MLGVANTHRWTLYTGTVLITVFMFLKKTIELSEPKVKWRQKQTSTQWFGEGSRVCSECYSHLVRVLLSSSFSVVVEGSQRRLPRKDDLWPETWNMSRDRIRRRDGNHFKKAVWCMNCIGLNHCYLWRHYKQLCMTVHKFQGSGVWWGWGMEEAGPRDHCLYRVFTWASLVAQW